MGADGAAFYIFMFRLSGDVLTPGLIWTDVTVGLRLGGVGPGDLRLGSENSDIIMMVIIVIVIISVPDIGIALLNVLRVHTKQNCV